MANETTVENTGGQAERLPTVEAPHSRLDQIIDTENTEAAEALVDKEAQDAVVEIKDFTDVADDPEMPEVSAPVKEAARKLEADILAKSNQTKKDVMQVFGGNQAEAPSAEADIAAPEAEAPKAVKPKMEGAAAVAPEQPAAEEENAEAPPLVDYFSRLDGLVAEFKANGLKSSNILSRKLIKLMGEVHPDKYPGNAEMAKLSATMGRLKSIFEGDMRSWETGKDVSFENDIAALKSEMMGGGAASPEKEGTENAADRAEEGAASPETAAAAGAEAAAASGAAKTVEGEPIGAPTAEAAQASVSKLNDQAESAFAKGDEEQMRLAVDEIEFRMNEQIAGRSKELDELYATPSAQRTELMQAKIDELEYANAIDRKSVERRKTQLSLIKLNKEKKTVDAEIMQVQTELKAFEGQQNDKLLPASTETGAAAMVVAGPDRKQELEMKLAGLLERQTELGQEIGKNEALSVELADSILQLTRLMDRAKQDQKRLGEEEEEAEERQAATERGGNGEKSPEAMGSGLDPAIKGPSLEKFLAPGEKIIGVVGEAMHDPLAAAGALTAKIFKPIGGIDKKKKEKDED